MNFFVPLSFVSSPIHNAAKIMEIDINADVSSIKKAFRKKALYLHPDKKTGNTEAFQELTNAYNILLDNKKNPKVSSPVYNESVYREDELSREADELYDILNQMYGGMMFNQPVVEHINFRVNVDIKDIWNNIDKKIHIHQYDCKLQLPLYYKNIIYQDRTKEISVEIIDKNDDIFKRRNNWDIQMIKKIELQNLYFPFDIKIILPDNKKICVQWKIDYIEKYLNINKTVFYLHNLGLPTPDGKRGKLYVILDIVYPINYSIFKKKMKNRKKEGKKGKDKTYTEVLPIWKIEHNNMINKRDIVLDIKKYIY